MKMLNNGNVHPYEFKKDIYHANLSYLLLAQRLIIQDKATAMLRLGIASPATANIIGELTHSQIVKLSEINQLICQFRFDNPKTITQLTQESRIEDLQQFHTTILLSSHLLNDIS